MNSEMNPFGKAYETFSLAPSGSKFQPPPPTKTLLDLGDTPPGKGVPIRPFYIVCDTSVPNVDNGRIETINKSLPEIHDVIASYPALSNLLYISVITFSEVPKMLIPLSHSFDIQDMPEVAVESSAFYKRIFAFLKIVIKEDRVRLKENANEVLSPLIAFITDGQPSDDDWSKELLALENNSKMHPSLSGMQPFIHYFGVEQSCEEILEKGRLVKDSSGFGFNINLVKNENLSEAILSFLRVFTGPFIHTGPSIQTPPKEHREIQETVEATRPAVIGDWYGGSPGSTKTLEKEVRTEELIEGLRVAIETLGKKKTGRRFRRKKKKSLESKNPPILNCSFCGKTQRQVKKLIAGPGVYICDECIDLCVEIIEEEKEKSRE